MKIKVPDLIQSVCQAQAQKAAYSLTDTATSNFVSNSTSELRLTSLWCNTIEAIEHMMLILESER